ncbi:hypothetical protein BH11MYX2_BH11MYX2_41270 [soil metagenome]
MKRKQAFGAKENQMITTNQTTTTCGCGTAMKKAAAVTAVFGIWTGF